MAVTVRLQGRLLRCSRPSSPRRNRRDNGRSGRVRAARVIIGQARRPGVRMIIAPRHTRRRPRAPSVRNPLQRGVLADAKAADAKVQGRAIVAAAPGIILRVTIRIHAGAETDKVRFRVADKGAQNPARPYVFNATPKGPERGCGASPAAACSIERKRAGFISGGLSLRTRCGWACATAALRRSFKLIRIEKAPLNAILKPRRRAPKRACWTS